MSEILIVRINEKLIPDFQINYNTKVKRAIKAPLSSWNDIVQVKGQELILMLAADLVFNTQVKIPSKNEEVIRQSIPFVIEEQLINEIAENHYAYTQTIEGEFLVSVVNNTIIQNIKKQLKQENLICEKLYTETFCIPSFNNKITLLIQDSYTLVNEGFFKGTILKNESLKSYLRLTNQQPKIIFSDQPVELSDKSKDIVKITNTSLLISESIFSNENINLFQGLYKSGNNEVKKTNPLKTAGILLTVLIVSWLSINLYQLWSLDSDIKLLQEQQKTFLLKVIPAANQTELNDPFAAIQSFLKVKENQMGATNSSGFITQLYYLGKTLVQFPTVQVQSLRQRTNKLEIKLLASDVSVLNKFQSSLEKIALSMRVKIGTRDSSKDGIVSVVTMEQL